MKLNRILLCDQQPFTERGSENAKHYGVQCFWVDGSLIFKKEFETYEKKRVLKRSAELQRKIKDR